MGACGIDKAKQQAESAFQRRQVGGIIAAVSGCRIICDWREHHGGESTSEVYQLLSDCVKELAGDTLAKQPNVVFMDNACALKKFAKNPVRAERTATTRILSKLHYMLDIWHVTNHNACLQDPVEAQFLDPRSSHNKDIQNAVNTEACEQAFSFLDRLTYVAYNMGPGLFHTYLYIIMNRENKKLSRRRELIAAVDL